MTISMLSSIRKWKRLRYQHRKSLQHATLSEQLLRVSVLASGQDISNTNCNLRAIGGEISLPIGLIIDIVVALYHFRYREFSPSKLLGLHA